MVSFPGPVPEFLVSSIEERGSGVGIGDEAMPFVHFVLTERQSRERWRKDRQDGGRKERGREGERDN